MKGVVRFHGGGSVLDIGVEGLVLRPTPQVFLWVMSVD